MNATVRPVELLLVEDSPVDVMLTREALLDAKIINNLHVVEHDETAIAYLRRLSPFQDVTRPDLILLALNSHRESGLHVLTEINNDPQLRLIPLVVMTSAAATDEVRKPYKGHAHCFITKPADLEGLVNIVRSIESFWFCMVTLPSTETNPATAEEP